MIVLYCLSDRSPCVSASRIPSVINFTTVSFVHTSVKRTCQPTSFPTSTFSSSATRRATDVAASLRGCVHPIRPSDPSSLANSIAIFGNCVVFPLPVSPTTTTTCEERIASRISSLRRETGRSGYVIVNAPSVAAVYDSRKPSPSSPKSFLPAAKSLPAPMGLPNIAKGTWRAVARKA